tara:strand:- start:5498 stop:5779 length:282 start_codon:yes stop_codon:yes gene_type:complete
MATDTDDRDLDALVGRIAASCGVSEGAARRVVEDVLAFHVETVEAFVQRRHRELAGSGLRNAEIYEALRREVAARAFPGPDLSVRQIRRIIYG